MIFSSFTALFTAISEVFKTLTSCKERQSESDVIKTKKSKSKAVNYAEKLIFYIDENYNVKNDKKYQHFRKLFFKYN